MISPEPTIVEKNIRNPWCNREYERSVVTLNEHTGINMKIELTTINPDGNLTMSGESGPNELRLEDFLSYVGNAKDEKKCVCMR